MDEDWVGEPGTSGVEVGGRRVLWRTEGDLQRLWSSEGVWFEINGIVTPANDEESFLIPVSSSVRVFPLRRLGGRLLAVGHISVWPCPRLRLN